MKIFNYGSPIKYSAGTSIEVAVTNLSRRVNKMDVVTAISSSVPESQLSGSVAENSVVLHRVRPFVWNLFKPHFHGSFKKEGGRVVLGGVYTMTGAAKLIFSAFFIILAIVEVVVLFGLLMLLSRRYLYPRHYLFLR
jgi:hypothetical protein